MAKAASEDATSKARGGELGWKRQGTTTLGPALETKVWAAKDGEVVGPEKGADGYYLVVAEGTREGDIPFDKVRAELAEDQLRQDKAKARAKADADAALAKAKGAAGKTPEGRCSRRRHDKDKEKNKVADAASAGARRPRRPACSSAAATTSRASAMSRRAGQGRRSR